MEVLLHPNAYKLNLTIEATYTYINPFSKIRCDETDEFNYRQAQYYRRDHPHGRTQTSASITDEGIGTIQYCQ